MVVRVQWLSHLTALPVQAITKAIQKLDKFFKCAKKCELSPATLVVSLIGYSARNGFVIDEIASPAARKASVETTDLISSLEVLYG
jgi:hypothetical protein